MFLFPRIYMPTWLRDTQKRQNLYAISLINLVLKNHAERIDENRKGTYFWWRPPARGAFPAVEFCIIQQRPTATGQIRLGKQTLSGSPGDKTYIPLP